MYKIIVNENLKSFSQDIRELMMAYFPYEDVKVCFNEEKTKKGEKVLRYHYDGDMYEDRKVFKDNIKRSIYAFLQYKTGKTLPWGSLTGIRPTNIVTDAYENKNFNDQNVKYLLNNEYFVSNKKTDLLINIAKTEIDILNRKIYDGYKNRYSIYVGVPFCKSTCLYCSFTSFDIDKHKKIVSKYLDTLEYEFEKETDGGKNYTDPDTLYIGGGTPTSLSNEDFHRFLEILDKYLHTKNSNREFTIEAGRPDTINKEKLLLMKEYGVNRISINPQTFNQKTLDLIGRNHSVEDIIYKYDLARSIGFDNINMDVILGLPDERLYNISHTFEELKKLAPDSITVHSLALKRAARLNREKENWMYNSYLAGLGEKNKFKNLIFNDDNKKDINLMYDLAYKNCEELNLYPYYLYRQKNMAGNLENVGFSKKGKECVYNIMMMSERQTVYGFGCGGVTKIVKWAGDGTHEVNRIEGYKGVYDYIKNMCEIRGT